MGGIEYCPEAIFTKPEANSKNREDTYKSGKQSAKSGGSLKKWEAICKTGWQFRKREATCKTWRPFKRWEAICKNEKQFKKPGRNL